MTHSFKENLMTTKDAGELSGYTSDYLARLVRSGEIQGKKIGHSWVVDSASLEAFMTKQQGRKLDRARELASSRVREYNKHNQLVRRTTRALTEKISIPQFSVQQVSLRSHSFAIGVAVMVVAIGAVGAQAAAVPQVVARASVLAAEISSGFVDAFGVVPARVAARMEDARTAVRADVVRSALASRRAGYVASPVLAAIDLETLQSVLVREYRAPRAAADIAFSPSRTDVPLLTVADVYASAAGAYTFLAHPASIGEALTDAYFAIGTDAYAAIGASFSTYRALIDDSGKATLSVAATTRDALAHMPRVVAQVNLALGEAVINATHAAIRTDVIAAHGLAAAAPESARVTVTLMGTAGDTLARAAEQVPARIATAYLRATAVPASLAPRLAQAIFGAEYAAASRFVAATGAVSERYLALVEGTGSLAYESSASVRSVAQSASRMIALAPAAIDDATLGMLGKSAAALDSVTHLSSFAAVLPALSASEKTALAVYEAIHSVFDSASGALVAFFTTTPETVLPTGVPQARVIAVATSTRPVASETQPVTAVSYPTYTTVVRGVSEDFMNQSLASLRTNVLATVAGMIQPVSSQVVQNITTIQQLNRIDSLHDLVVENGDFRNSIFDSGIRVSARDGYFDALTAGTTTLANTTVNGDIAITGAVSTPSTVTAGYFVATRANATSTFAGSLNVDNAGFVYATSTRNVGIGVLSPAALLAVQNSTSTQPIFVASNAAGAEVYRLTNSGFVGIGTTSPTYNLAVEGSSTLGNQAIAGYFTATTSTATSTFAGGLAVGTDKLVVDSTTGNIGIGTTSPYQKLSVAGNVIADTFIATSTAGTSTFAGALAVSGLSSFTLASTSRLSVFDYAWFGGSATSTFTSNGYLGILNAAPAYPLDVTGIGRFSSLVDASHFVATSTSATSTFAGGLAVGTSRLLVDSTTGRVGIGTTSPSGTLAVSGDFFLTGSTTITGADSGIVFTGSGNHDITASGGTLRIGTNTIIGNVEALNDTVDIGTPAVRFDKLYVNEVNASTIVGTLTGGNLSAETFTINSDNATADTENSYLSFERGSTGPNALLTWNAAESAKRFEFNQPLFIQNASASTTLTTLDLKAVAGQIADIFRIASSSGTNLLNFTASGNLGIGTTTPFSRLSVTGAGTGTGRGLSVADSSNVDNFYVLDNGNAYHKGNVGIGTTAPGYKLDVAGTINNTGAITTGGEITVTKVSPALNLRSSATTAGLKQYLTFGDGTYNREQFIGTNLNTQEGQLDLNIYTDAGAATNVMTWKSSGNVGIGTTSPSGNLVVNGTTGQNLFQIATSTNQSILIVNQNGLMNVGANSTAIPSTALLTTTGSAAGTVTGIQIVNDNPTSTVNNAAGLTFRVNNNNGIGGYYGELASIAGVTDSIAGGTRGTALAFSVSTPQSAPSALSEKMRITSTGNLGIGTTSPSTTLAVQGNGLFSGNLTAANMVATGTLSVAGVITASAGSVSATAIQHPSNAGTGIYFPTVNQVAFAANGSSNLTVTPAGVSVGGTVGVTITTAGNVSATSLNWGTNGTGLYGDATSVNTAVAGANVWSATASGLAVTGVLSTTGNITQTGGAIIAQNGAITGNGAILVGADISASTLTDATRKIGVVSTPHYTNAQAKMLDFWSDSDATTNTITIGGGLAGFHAATNVKIYAAATNTGGAGASVAAFTSAGAAITGTLSATATTTSTGGIVGPNNFVVQQTSGNVGIGTASPNTKLDVVGELMVEESAGGYFSSLYSSSGRPRLQFYAQSGKGLDIGTVTGYAGTGWGSLMSILNTGNVGIGTTNPGTKLSVQGTATNGATTTVARLFQLGTGSGTGSILELGYGDTMVSSAALGGIYDGTGRALTFYSGADTSSQYLERMRITSAGNVGIGTTSPSTTLAVQGNGLFSGNLTAANVVATGTLSVAGAGSVASLSVTGDAGLNVKNSTMTTGISAHYSTTGGLSSYGVLSFNDVYTVTGMQGFMGGGSGGTALRAKIPTGHVFGVDVNNVEVLSVASTGLAVTGTLSATATTTSTGGIVGPNNFVVQQTSGNVGVGIVNPSHKLQIVGSNNATELKISSTDQGSGAILFGDGASALKNVGIWRGNANSYAVNGNWMNFGTYGDGGFVWATGNAELGSQTERMRLSAATGLVTIAQNLTVSGTGNTTIAGSVGIGTTTPSSSSRLTVYNGSDSRFDVVSAAANAAVRIISNNSAYGSIDAMDVNYSIAKNLVLNPNGGNIGIGTTSPSQRLTVQGASARAYIYDSSNNAMLRIIPNSSTGVTLDATSGTFGALNLLLNPTAGNVGIGTTNPQSVLQITGPSSSPNNALFVTTNTWDTSNGSAVRIGTGATSGNTYGVIDVLQSGWQQGNGNLAIAPLGGNVGIGTTNPGYKLDISSATDYAHLRLGGAGVPLLKFANNDYNNGNGMEIYQPDDGSVDFRRNSSSGSQFLVVNANGNMALLNGNVGIGTTSPLGTLHVTGSSFIDSTSGSALRVRQAAGLNTIFNINSDGTSGNTALVNITAGTGQTVPYFQIGTSFGNGNVFQVLQNGNVGIGTTTPGFKLQVAGGSASAQIGISDTDSGVDGKHWAIQSLNSSGNAQLRFRAINDSLSSGINALVISRSGVSSVTSYFENGNVGIGTTSPGSKLDIYSNVTSASLLKVYTDGTANGWTFASAGGDRSRVSLSGYSGATQNIRFDPDSGAVSYINAGNVGIGTTSPTYKLSVEGSSTLGNQAIAGYFTATTSTATSTFAGGLAVETSGLVYDYSSNKVGIGTASPTARLHINVDDTTHTGLLVGTNANTASAMSFNSRAFFGYGGNDLTVVQAIAGKGIQFNVNNNTFGSGEAMRITSAGNVGIGTTNPGTALDVVGVTRTSTYFSANGVGFIRGDTVGSLVVQGGLTDTSFTNNANNTVNLTILNSGNVGIGTTSPDGKLHVYTSTAGNVAPVTSADDLIVESGGQTGITLLSPDASPTSIAFGSPTDAFGALLQWTHDSDLFSIGTQNTGGDIALVTGNNAEAVRILDSGNVGIGTTSPNSLLNLHANTNGDVFQLALDNENASGGVGISLQRNNSIRAAQIKFGLNGTDEWYMGELRRGGGGVLGFSIGTGADTNSVTPYFHILQSSGNVGIGTTNPTQELTVYGSGNNSTEINIIEPDGASESILNFGDSLTGTARYEGRIAYSHTTNALNFSTNHLVGTPELTLKNGNVGVGTTSPWGRLSADTSSLAAGVPSFVVGSSTRTDLVVTQAGYVGIGTSAPISLFDMYKTGSGAASKGATFRDNVTPTYATNADNLLTVRGTGSSVGTWRGRITAGGDTVEFLMGEYNSQAWLGAHNAALGAWADLYISPDGSTQKTYIGSIGGVGGGPALTVQSSNGNVGIGTASPSQLLEISKTTDGGAIRISSTQNDTSHSLTTPFGSLEFYSADASSPGAGVRGAIHVYPTDTAASGGADMAFATSYSAAANFERMRITSTGNVGIGTTSPAVNLDVAGASHVYSRITTTGTSHVAEFLSVTPTTNLEVGGYGGYSTTRFGVSTVGMNGVIANTGGLLIGTLGASDLVIGTNNTDRIHVLSTGNVGIGTTSPTTLLEVRGAGAGDTGLITLDSTSAYGSIVFREARTLRGSMGFGDAGNIFAGALSNSMSIRSENALHFGSGTEVDMTIDTSGNVGIGTTTPDVLLVLSKNRINGSTYVQQNLDAQTMSQTEAGSGVVTGYSRGNGTSYFGAVGGYANGTNAGLGLWGNPTVTAGVVSGIPNLFVNSGGNVGIGTTSPSALLSLGNGSGAAGTTAALGINFGDPSANLYRSAAATISTDGTLRVSGTAINNNSITSATSQAMYVQSPATTGGDIIIRPQSSEVMRITTTGNVGIGTTSPVSKLSVVGESALAGGLSVGLGYAGTAAPTGGMIIQGNVGIGTTSPQTKLHVETSGAGNFLTLNAATSGQENGIFFEDNTTKRWEVYNQTQSNLDLFHFYNYKLGGDVMTLRDSGNVGIGTTSPSTKFSVGGAAGDTTGHGYFTGGLGVGVVNTTAGSIQASGTGTFANLTTTGSDFALLLSNSGAATIKESGGGYLVISTAANNIYMDPAGSLYVRPAGGHTAMTVSSGASVVNYLDVAGANASAGPIVSAVGSDTNIPINITGKGTGNIILNGATTGNVGIGTTTPAQKLTVNGGLMVEGGSAPVGYNAGALYWSGNVFQIEGRTSTGFASNRYEGVQHIFNVSGSEKARIDPNGNVGIGETAPGSKLSVSGGATIGASYDTTAAPSNGLIVEGNVGIGTTTPATTFSVQGNGLFSGNLTAANITATGTLSIAGATTFSSTATTTFAGPIGSASGDFIIGASGTTNDVLLNPYGGNVGIGTMSPGSLLDVFSSTAAVTGRIRSTNSNVYLELARADGSSDGYVNYKTGATSVWTTGLFALDSSFHFREAGNERVTLLAGGNVGIGTSTPWGKLSVTNTGAGPSFVVEDSTSPDTTPFIIDASGNVLIATTSAMAWTAPHGGYLLEVSKSQNAFTEMLVSNASTASAGQANLETRSDTATLYIGSAGSGSAYQTAGTNFIDSRGSALTFSQTGVEKMRLSATGYLGIGTTNPGTYGTLESWSAVASGASVPGNIAAVDTTAMAAGVGGQVTYAGQYINGTYTYAAYTRAVKENATSGNYAFGLALGTRANGGSLGEVMRLTSTGNVGIGTTDPQALLQVNGNIISRANQAGIGNVSQLGFVNGSSNGNVKSGIGAVTDTTLNRQGLYFFTSADGNTGTEKVRIDSSGNVGIGTTSPFSRLSVTGAGTGTGRGFSVANSSDVDNFYVLDSGNTYVKGNIGVGATQSAWVSDFRAIELGSAGNSFFGGTNSYRRVGMAANAYASGASVTMKYVSTAAAGRYDIMSDSHAWYIAPSGTAGNDITWTQAMTLNSSGNVGIGTTSPSALLSLGNGSGAAGTTAALGINFGDPTANLYRSAAGTIKTDGILYVNTINGGGGSSAGLDIFYTRANDLRMASGEGGFKAGNTKGFVFSSDGTGYGTADTGLSRGAAGKVYVGNGTIGDYTGTLIAGNLGVGTTSPWGQLSVNPNGITGPAFVVGSSTATNFIVTNGGKVGVGTASPSEKLHVTGAVLAGTGVSTGGSLVLAGIYNGANDYLLTLGSMYSTGGTSLGFGVKPSTVSSSYVSATSITVGRNAITMDGTATRFLFASPQAVAQDSAVSMSENMTMVNATGNLGIGTTSPASRLAVSGGATIGANYNVAAPTNGLIVEGNVGIGTASPNSSYGLDVRSSMFTSTGINFGTGVAGNGQNQGFVGPVNSTLFTIATQATTGANHELSFQTTNNYVTSEAMRINYLGNVGVGTTSPWGRLSADTSSLATGVPSFVVGSSTRTDLIVTQAGYVGIGTAAPNTNLHIYNTGTAGSLRTLLKLQTADSNTGTGASIDFSEGTNDTVTARISKVYEAGGKQGLAFSTFNSPTLSEKLRITNDGNVGIGTTSPLSRLSVTGAGTGTGRGFSVADSSNVDKFYVLDNGNAYMKGNVGIGTTSPSAKLEVNGSTNLYSTVRIISAGLQMDNGQSITMASAAGVQRQAMVVDSSNNLSLGGTVDAGIIFYTSLGNERMRITTAGNVGIGTTSPGSKLVVSGSQAAMVVDSAGGGSALRFLANNGTNYIQSTDVAGSATGVDLNFGSVGNNWVTIKGTGNVGIGTTAPGAKLDVKSSAVNEVGFNLQNTNGNRIFSVTNTDGVNQGGFLVLGSEASPITSTITGGTIRLSGAAGFNSWINNGGNVGIGTTTPGAKLDVYGVPTTAQLARIEGASASTVLANDYAYLSLHNANTTNSNYSSLYFDTNDTVGAYKSGAAIQGIYTSHSSVSGELAFSTNNAGTFGEKMRITAAGNVGIGTTTPTQKLDVVGFINTDQYSGYKQAGNTILYASTTNFATLVGIGAGSALLPGGIQNTALGYQALNTVTTADYNTAIGYQTLFSNTSGENNTANGVQALYSNTTGTNNTANGMSVLYSNNTGANNTANGMNALYSNNAGGHNTANGVNALYSNTTGTNNTANGSNALYLNASATSTTAFGAFAGRGTTAYNSQGGVYVGYGSGYDAGTGSDYNTFVGYQSGRGVTTGSNNIWIGTATSSTAIANLTTGSQNILIGNNISLPSATASGQLNIGNIIFGTGVTGTGSALSTGNVGIGTTTPGVLLDTWKNTSGGATTQSAGRFVYNNTGGGIAAGNGVSIDFLLHGATGPFTGTGKIKYVSESGTGNDASLRFDSSDTSDALTIFSTGNVGIGTTTPTQKLTVEGSSSSGYFGIGTKNTNASGASAVTLFNNVGNDAAIQFWGSGAAATNANNLVLVNDASGGAIKMIAGAAERFRLTSTGNVGIGTTSPATLFEVGGSTANVTFDGYLNCTGFTSNANGLLACTASDERLKQNVVALDGANALAGLNALNPVSFYWNPAAERSSAQQYGLIAQQVQTVFPNLVATSSPTVLTPDGTLSVNYEGLISPMVMAIQELDARTTFIANSATSTILTVDVAGHVGIGTTTPNHTLSVAGDIGAIAFVNTSTRSAKTDIDYATASSSEDRLSQLVNLKVAKYRYTIEDQNDPLRLGLIAEDTQAIAPEILSADGKGVDIYELATFTLSGVQALAAKVDAQETRMVSLEDRINALESGTVSSASGSPITFSTSSLASALEGFGVLIRNGIAQFNTLVFRQLVASRDADGTSSAGSVTIIGGNTIAQVTNSLVMPSTKVFVTFNSSVTGSWWVSDKTNGSFRVVLSEPQSGDVSFDYFLVQTEGQIATSTPVTAGSTQSTGTTSGTDTTAPVITLLGDNPLHLSVGGTFVEPGVTVTDNADASVPYVTFVNGIEMEASAGSIDTSVQTTYIITYSATDARGNLATATRSVIIGSATATPSDTGSTTTPASADTTAPVVSLTGGAALELTVGDTFADPSATATDDTDGDVTPSIAVSGAVDTATEGLYTLTYTATDAAGNTGSASRVVTVVAAAAPAPAPAPEPAPAI